MSDELERAEEHRDRTAGLEYEEKRCRCFADVDCGNHGSERDDDAYELDDPKHPRHQDVYADWADAA